MAISRIQQTQISGSLSGSFSDGLSAGSDLARQTTIGGDLNALRSQIKRIVGNASWYDDLDGSQDLADIYAAIHAEGAGAAFQGAITTVGSASIGGDFSATGAGSFASTLGVTGVATFSNNVGVAGSGSIGGTLAVTGASGLTGPVTAGDTLSVTGAATFSNNVGIVGAASVGGTLGVTGTSSFIGAASFASTTNSMNQLSVTGSSGLSVTSNATITGMLGVGGASTLTGAITAGSTLAVAGASTFASTNSMNQLSVTGSSGLSVTGPSTLSGAVSMGSNLLVDGDAQINGDLLVRGAFTYIETTNMKVKDAFIYLATGSNGSVDSGIVLSKGAGASYDLIVGQDGGAGELVFGKVAHNADGDSPADINGAALVPAWMSSFKIGSSEGNLSGSLAVSNGGVELTSEASKTILISAAADLRFAANGNSAISFASSSDTPNGSFVATTVMGMLNELRIDLDAAGAGGNLDKENYTLSGFTGNILTFSNNPALAGANHKLIDVYLNGVLMVPDRDLTDLSTTTVTFDASIVSSLMADDVITVITRG